MLITLQEVTANTVRAIVGLKVRPEQEAYVAANAVSISEAYFHPEAWFRAVYADGTPVGFVMLSDETLLGRGQTVSELGLWRFMIDASHQRHGIGGQALELVVEHARTRPGINRVLTSCVPGPHSPQAFYEQHGFRPTGAVDEGEVVLARDLR